MSRGVVYEPGVGCGLRRFGPGRSGCHGGQLAGEILAHRRDGFQCLSSSMSYGTVWVSWAVSEARYSKGVWPPRLWWGLQVLNSSAKASIHRLRLSRLSGRSQTAWNSYRHVPLLRSTCPLSSGVRGGSVQRSMPSLWHSVSKLALNSEAPVDLDGLDREGHGAAQLVEEASGVVGGCAPPGLCAGPFGDGIGGGELLDGGAAPVRV